MARLRWRRRSERSGPRSADGCACFRGLNLTRSFKNTQSRQHGLPGRRRRARRRQPQRRILNAVAEEEQGTRVCCAQAGVGASVLRNLPRGDACQRVPPRWPGTLLLKRSSQFEERITGRKEHQAANISPIVGFISERQPHIVYSTSFVTTTIGPSACALARTVSPVSPLPSS